MDSIRNVSLCSNMEATMQTQHTTSPTHVIHTSTVPKQAAPKPADTVQNRHHGFPLFENYMKMARFNSSEREVLEKCLIPTVPPHRSSISSHIRPQGGDSMSHLLDLDDDYLLKVRIVLRSLKDDMDIPVPRESFQTTQFCVGHSYQVKNQRYHLPYILIIIYCIKYSMHESHTT